MEDINDKITGGSLPAAEWNQLPSELQNVIEALGITLAGGDLNQLGKAIAGYAANSSFYTDSGVADAYVLTTIGSKQSLTAYTDGAEFEFEAGNENTGGAATVNVAGLGLKDIKLKGGANPPVGHISGRVKLKFDNSNDRCELIRSGMSILTVVSATDATWDFQPDTKSYNIFAIGGGGGGGGVDGQGSGTAACSEGGGGGGRSRLTRSQVPSSLNITIGAGGTAGAAGNNDGSVGGDTTVVDNDTGLVVNIDASGGPGGQGRVASASPSAFEGSEGGGASGGDVNLTGSASTCAQSDGILRIALSTSGAGIDGAGSVPGAKSVTGADADTFGAGGGSTSINDVGTNLAGGDGYQGVVIIEEFF